MSYKVDTEILICSIENYKCIWDSSSEDYKNRDVKNKAYRDVAVLAVHDFENLTCKEQAKAVQLVQKRWKSSRDAYVRDRAKLKKTKSGDAARIVKKYVYFDHLKFLDKTIDLNATETSLICTQFEDACTEDNLDASTVLCPSEDENIKETPDKPSENLTRQKRKKKESVDDRLLQFLKDSERSEEDDNRAFLLSLLPTLRTFNQTETLLFRSEVLKIIMELKNITHPSYFPNASYQTVHYSNPPSRPSSNATLFSSTPEVSPNSTYSNLRSASSVLSSGNTQPTAIINETYAPMLIDICGNQFDQSQSSRYIVSAINRTPNCEN